MPESGTMNYLSAVGLGPRRTLEKLRYPPARAIQKKKGGAGKKSGKPQKEIDMTEVYDELLSGKKIHEVAEAHGVSQKPLENRHKKYQKENLGKTGGYIRKRLVDFRGQGESCRNGKTDSQMRETEK